MTTESLKKMIALDPRAGEQPVDSVTTAPRLDTLDGKRIALLHDQRLNGDKLLFMVAGLLEEKYELGEVVYHAKPHVSDVSPPELLDKLAQNFDAAIIAIGDWGSCSTCCMHDSISLEKRGLPSAVIISEEFIPGVKSIARSLGLPDYPFVVVKHPIGSLPQEALKERAKAAATQVIDILLKG